MADRYESIYTGQEVDERLGKVNDLQQDVAGLEQAIQDLTPPTPDPEGEIYESQFDGAEIDRRLARLGELEAIVERVEQEVQDKYTFPDGGIPAEDLDEDVQVSLAAADTAVQPAALDDYYTKPETDALIPDVSNFITKTVNDLVYYYKKSETYTKAQVDDLVSGVASVSFVVADSLPSAGAETMGKIYLIPSADPAQSNVKDEFITIDNGDGAILRYTWEQIGSTAVDLSGYATTQDLNDAVADVVRYTVQSLTSEQQAQARTNIGAGTYSKPGSGIPASDLASGVIPDVSNFITNSVNDLTNYYLKTETYTKAEVEGLIAAISQFHYEIYASTSAVTSPASNVLYLIGPTGSGSDKYEEYVYSNNAFVKIGDTSIDLSGYVTTQALNTALTAYTTTADLTTLLAGKQDTIADLADIRAGASNTVKYTQQTLTSAQKEQARENAGAQGLHEGATSGVTNPKEGDICVESNWQSISPTYTGASTVSFTYRVYDVHSYTGSLRITAFSEYGWWIDRGSTAHLLDDTPIIIPAGEAASIRIEASLGETPSLTIEEQQGTTNNKEYYNGAWRDRAYPHGVPSGGSSGQVLKKASGTDYDLEWANESGGGGGLPAGGTKGQTLVKQSAIDGDAVWMELYKYGVISQTQTWTGSDAAGYDYTMSDLVRGYIPKANIDIFATVGASFNETTGYFELNGLTDLSYNEMQLVYVKSIGKDRYPNYENRFMSDSERTILSLHPTPAHGTSHGSVTESAINCSIMAAHSYIEVFVWQDEEGASSFTTRFRKISNMNYAFRQCIRLKEVKGAMNVNSVSSAFGDQTFANCWNLQKVLLYGLKVNCPIKYSSRLSLASVVFLVNNAANTTAITITLHATAYARCQADTTEYTYNSNTYTGILAFASAKNITIASA